MALDRNSLIALARANAKASLNPSKTYSFEGQSLTAEALNQTFINELNELGSTPHQFDENRNLIYTLMEESLSEVLPAKVMQAYGQFADIKTYPQGTKPVFKIKVTEASKKRAKQFVTKVGLAGRYETFKLDGKTLEVPTSAYGGAARLEWEELLDGRATMSDYYNIVLEGLDEKIYQEIAKSLKAFVSNVKSTNKNNGTSNGFDEAEFDRLIQIADAYGKATIYCTFEFAAKIKPAEAWASDSVKDQLWNHGYVTTYKGHNVVVLPQSFTDETNTEKVMDPSIAYIIPTGSEKPVKVAFEGDAQVRSIMREDWSTEMQTYQKVGVATYVDNPGICVYTMTELAED